MSTATIEEPPLVDSTILSSESGLPNLRGAEAWRFFWKHFADNEEFIRSAVFALFQGCTERKCPFPETIVDALELDGKPQDFNAVVRGIAALTAEARDDILIAIIRANAAFQRLQS